LFTIVQPGVSSAERWSPNTSQTAASLSEPSKTAGGQGLYHWNHGNTVCERFDQ